MLDPMSMDGLRVGMLLGGCSDTLLSETGIEMLRQASQGKPRQAGLILKTAMHLALPKGLNHLPDDLLREAITSLQ